MKLNFKKLFIEFIINFFMLIYFFKINFIILNEIFYLSFHIYARYVSTNTIYYSISKNFDRQQFNIGNNIAFNI